MKGTGKGGCRYEGGRGKEAAGMKGAGKGGCRYEGGRRRGDWFSTDTCIPQH